jgi:hypothetical protein
MIASLRYLDTLANIEEGLVPPEAQLILDWSEA